VTVPRHHPIFPLREDTLRRLKEFQGLLISLPQPTILDHILAADALLLGLAVNAHHVPGSDLASPDRSQPVLPPPEEEARTSLIFANYSMFDLATRRLGKLIDLCRQRYVGTSSREVQTNLANWRHTHQNAESILTYIRNARFEGSAILEGVTNCWPQLIGTIQHIETHYKELIAFQNNKLSFGRRDILLVLLSLGVFVIIFVLVQRLLS
jgi:hypothetical protein